jgi:hypothetical protein
MAATRAGVILAAASSPASLERVGSLIPAAVRASVSAVPGVAAVVGSRFVDVMQTAAVPRFAAAVVSAATE